MEIFVEKGKVFVNKNTDKWMLILYRNNCDDFFLEGILKIASFSPKMAKDIVQRLKEQPQVVIATGKHERLREVYETLILAFIECSLVRITTMN